MTRALTKAELDALIEGSDVSRFTGIGRIENGFVSRFTATQIIVSWPSESCRYYKESGARTDCHGEILRAVAQQTDESMPDVEHAATELGDDAANIEPNDEAQIVATVKADRTRAKAMSERHWLNAVQRFLLERLEWESATADEEHTLQEALAMDATEPHAIAMRDLAKREAPYITAASLSAWVVRQRRAVLTPPLVRAFLAISG